MLTEREQDVVSLAVRRLSDKLITKRFGINPRAIEVHHGHLLNELVVGPIMEPPADFLVNGRGH